MKTARMPCGCKYEVGERERWLELCPTHQAEFDETHARWARERAERRELDQTGEARRTA